MTDNENDTGLTAITLEQGLIGWYVSGITPKRWYFRKAQAIEDFLDRFETALDTLKQNQEPENV